MACPRLIRWSNVIDDARRSAKCDAGRFPVRCARRFDRSVRRFHQRTGWDSERKRFEHLQMQYEMMRLQIDCHATHDDTSAQASTASRHNSML